MSILLLQIVNKVSNIKLIKCDLLKGNYSIQLLKQYSFLPNMPMLMFFMCKHYIDSDVLHVVFMRQSSLTIMFIRILFNTVSSLKIVLDCGKVISWGRSDYGQLGLGDGVVKQGYSYLAQEIENVGHPIQVIFVFDMTSQISLGVNSKSRRGHQSE